MKQFFFYGRRPGLADNVAAEVFRVLLDNGDHADGKALLSVVAETGAAGGDRQSVLYEIIWSFVRKTTIFGNAPTVNVLHNGADSVGAVPTVTWTHDASSNTHVVFSVQANVVNTATAIYVEGLWMQTSPQEITVFAP